MYRSKHLIVFVVALSTFSVSDRATAQVLRLPFVNIDRSNGQLRVQAPFVDVQRNNGITSVRAPFTNVVRPSRQWQGQPGQIQPPQVQYYRTPYGLRRVYVYPQQQQPTYVQPQNGRYTPQQSQARTYQPTQPTSPPALIPQPSNPSLLPPSPVQGVAGNSPRLLPPTPVPVPRSNEPTPIGKKAGPDLLPIPDTPLDAPDTLDQPDPVESEDDTTADFRPPAQVVRKVQRDVDYAFQVELKNSVKVVNSNGAQATSTANGVEQISTTEDDDGFVVVRSRRKKNQSKVTQVGAELGAPALEFSEPAAATTGLNASGVTSDAPGQVDEEPHHSLVLKVDGDQGVPEMKVSRRTSRTDPANGTIAYRLVAIPHSDLADHYTPQAGIHVFALIHPTTREPLIVKLQVPAGQPKFDLRRDRVVLTYATEERTIFFTSDGDVVVKEQ